MNEKEKAAKRLLEARGYKVKKPALVESVQIRERKPVTFAELGITPESIRERVASKTARKADSAATLDHLLTLRAKGGLTALAEKAKERQSAVNARFLG